MPDFAFQHKTELDPHLEETESKAPSYAMLSYSRFFDPEELRCTTLTVHLCNQREVSALVSIHLSKFWAQVFSMYVPSNKPWQLCWPTDFLGSLKNTGSASALGTLAYLEPSRQYFDWCKSHLFFCGYPSHRGGSLCSCLWGTLCSLQHLITTKIWSSVGAARMRVAFKSLV